MWPFLESLQHNDALIIIAGALHVELADRSRYLAEAVDSTHLTRAALGCLDLVQAADQLAPTRINIYERWESDDDLHRFRTAGDPAPGASNATKGERAQVPSL